LSYENNWFEEGNVAKKVKEFLSKNGYNITKFNEDKRERGHDIEAVKDEKRFIIEVKGFPWDRYVRGPKKGMKKPTHPNLQAKHWFAEALLSLIMAKSKDPIVEVGMGLPYNKKNLEFISKVKILKEKINLKYFLVNENGDVKIH